MSLTVATWNINSVRLRIGNVERFLKLRKPDVLCLQETKCPDEFFPHQPFEALGYKHRLIQGMKAYNGVAILSKVPFTAMNVHHRCGKEDCRHIEAALDVGGDPILLVAPLEHDVWNHKQLLKIVSHTPVEVDLFGKMMASLDWIDVPRRFVPADKKLYSWWSYRNNDWRASNRGRRLDHILVTPALGDAIRSYRIDSDLRDWDLPSDHVPVLATFDV